MKSLEFQTLSPRQGSGRRVVCFVATAYQIAQIARVQRIGRDAAGKLSGFQRPQVASHIREIRDFLQQPDAMVPTSIVLAFGGRVRLSRVGCLSINIAQGPPGWVVDGQQRLAAALALPNDGFEFVVTAFLCDDLSELTRQFILVNNTRPLAKTLIYELLPSAEGLPHRLSDRSGAALLTEALNYRNDSSLRGKIHQHTNPEGIIRDTLVQKVLINSLQQGALREFASRQRLTGDGYHLVSDFFEAVQVTFGKDWEGHTPKTSRLLHGVGLVALGFVMDELAITRGARSEKQFRRGLMPLIGKTHWTSGEWKFGTEKRPWNALQNTNADYRLLSHHLVRLVRRAKAPRLG